MTTVAAEYARRCETPSDIVDWLPVLFDVVCRYPGATVVELGVRDGNSTSALLAAVEQVGGTLFAVDIVEPRIPPVVAEHPSCTVIVGNDTDGHIAAQVPKRIDVLFVDTSHHYDHTLRELDIYMPRVTGMALFHDTELERPDFADPADPPYPVARALDDWSVRNKRTWRNNPGCWGLGVIEVEHA